MALSCVPAVMFVFCTTADNADWSVYKVKSAAEVGKNTCHLIKYNVLALASRQ